MQDFKELTECLCCGSDGLRTVLDLGFQPLANNSLKSRLELEKSFPLKLNYCKNCTHLQLKHAVNPDLMFKDYLYVTGGGGVTIRQSLENFIESTEETFYLSLSVNNKKILDIACNDGTLLDLYKAKGYDTYGIDPSVNLYSISSQNHHVICDYLSFEHAMMWKNKFSIIIAQNVIAHNSYPLEFLQICSAMLAPGGYIFIQNSQANMIQNGEFDTIYHEHISFYSDESFKTLSTRAGLFLIDKMTDPIHGISRIFVLSRDRQEPISGRFLEEKNHQRTIEMIDQYARQVRWTIEMLKVFVGTMRQQGYKVVGYGAAAKGNTLINSSKINLSYIVDDTPGKQGLFTPGAHIPIVSRETLSQEHDKVCVVPLAWNFYDEIKKNTLEKLKAREIVFLRYFPNFSVERVRQ